jgi:MFS family permease
MDRGAAGVQFVYLRGQTGYHTVLDNVERLGRGSLQMHGGYAVGLIRELGDAELTRRTGDRSTYFNVTGGVIVQHGPAVAGLLALAALGLLVAAVAAGLRRGVLIVRGLIGVLALPLTTLLTTAVAFLAWFGLKAAVPDLGVFTLGTDQNAFFVFGLVAFAFGVFAALYTPLLRRMRTENLALGALASWVVLSVGFAVAAPSAAYLWTLPALAAAGVALWRISGERSGAWRWAAGVGVPLAVLIVIYAPVMLIFTVLAFRLEGMGLPAVGIMGLFTALAAGLLVPHLGPRLAGRRALLGSRWLAPVAAAALAVVLVAVGVARLGYDEAYPRPDFVSYVLDADSGRAAWETGDHHFWTEPLLRNAREADVELAPFSTFSGWRAPAPAVDLPGPELERVGARSDGDTVSMRLRLRSARSADNLATEFRASGPILAASVEGRELPPTADMRDGVLSSRTSGSRPTASRWSSSSAAAGRCVPR